MKFKNFKITTVQYITKIEYIPTERRLSVALTNNPDNPVIDCLLTFNDVHSFYEEVVCEDYDDPYLESCIDIVETNMKNHTHYRIVTDEREISFRTYKPPDIWMRSVDNPL